LNNIWKVVSKSGLRAVIHGNNKETQTRVTIYRYSHLYLGFKKEWRGAKVAINSKIDFSLLQLEQVIDY
jgi:hypothetical protein